MIADLKPYAEYKESGLPWLGQVPGHWSVSRIKTVLRETDCRATDSSGTLLSLTRVRGLIPHRDMTDKMHSAKTLVGYKRYCAGQLVMNRMQAWSGMFGAGAMDGLVSPDYSVFDVLGGHAIKLVLERLKTPDLVAQFALESKGIGSGFNRLYTDRFGPIPISLPPLAEQAAIVRFLDWANGRFERAIRAKRKVIALLNEQKQAIIHHAVTRGLDPSVPLKPSGIPWLGDIPQHWEVRRLKHTFKRIFGGSTPASGTTRYWNGDIVWVTPADVSKSAFLSHSIRRITRQGLQACSTELVPEGSIIVTSRAPVGNVSIARVALCTNQGCKALIPDETWVLQMFAFWSLTVMKSELQNRASGTTFSEISTTKVSACTMALPSLDEQARIFAYINAETKSIDLAISRLEREIVLLREYRTRLIADVVTGKLDVREAATQLPAAEPAPDEALEEIEEEEIKV